MKRNTQILDVAIEALSNGPMTTKKLEKAFKLFDVRQARKLSHLSDEEIAESSLGTYDFRWEVQQGMKKNSYGGFFIHKTKVNKNVLWSLETFKQEDKT